MTLAECLTLLGACPNVSDPRIHEAGRYLAVFVGNLTFDRWPPEDVNDAKAAVVGRFLDGRARWIWAADGPNPAPEVLDRLARAYLFTAVRNQLISDWRKRMREAKARAKLTISTPPTPVIEPDIEEVRAAFDQTVANARADRREEFAADLDATCAEVWSVMTGEHTLMDLVLGSSNGPTEPGTRSTAYERLRQRHYRARRDLLATLDVLLETEVVDRPTGLYLRSKLMGRTQGRRQSLEGEGEA